MDMSSSNSTVMDTMVPYLHFAGGDNLLFEAWQPSSKGALAGACIGLVFYAIFERWVNGMRGVLEARWKKQYVPYSPDRCVMLMRFILPVAQSLGNHVAVSIRG